MKTIKIALAIGIAIAIPALCWTIGARVVAQEPPLPQLTPAELDLLHRQETWISALEWCESRGKNTALNPEDLDGTPSYSNFQWKPSTLLGYEKQYGLIATSTKLVDVPNLLKDYELQRDIVRHMIKDKNVVWSKQFPDCTKRFVGLPPTK
jgi:hypothetical protein